MQTAKLIKKPKPKILYAIIKKSEPEIKQKELYDSDQIKGIVVNKGEVIIKVKVIYE